MDVVIANPTHPNMICIMHIIHDNTCNNNYCSGQDTIIHRMHTQKRIYSLALETYGCLHYHSDSFFTTWAKATIAHHQRSSLSPRMIISYYQQHMSITLQRAQAIVIHQRSTTLRKQSSSLPHIIANTLPSLADL
jgi:hypothetical protein